VLPEVGCLVEGPAAYAHLSGRANLRLLDACGPRGRGGRRGRSARVDLALERVGMSRAADRSVRGYSLGMRQRLGLAAALLQEPRLLVLDEPTAGVDPAGSREIRDLILSFKARGITVLLCSHLLGQVQEICDRIGILHQGVLVREGRLEELISIENQTELILENATPELLSRMQTMITEASATLVEQRKPQTTLEKYFLEVTGGNK
jgi:ABC-2 type transport system ATP-binding protein